MLDVLVSSLATGLSDWKNLSLDWSVLAAVVDVRGAGEGTVTEAEGLDAKAVGEEKLEAGWGGDNELEKVEGALGFSFSHVGPSLGAGVGVGVLVILGSGEEGEVNLVIGVFLGKSRSGALGFVGDSDFAQFR